MIKNHSKHLSEHRFLLFVLFIFSSVLATEITAESIANDSITLNREVITSFIQVTDKMSVLNKEYPELAEHSQQFNFEQSEEIIQFLKKSKAYPEIEAILENSKLNRLLDIFHISQKVMGGLYYLNRANEDSNQSISQFETIRKVLQNNLKTLKKQDEESYTQDNATLIKESEAQLELLDKQLIIVNQALNSLSEGDKVFLDNDSSWFKLKFSPAEK